MERHWHYVQFKLLSDCFSLKNIDLRGLSEHWLYEKDLIFLNQINSNYNCHVVSDFDLRFPGRRRVGKGGIKGWTV